MATATFQAWGKLRRADDGSVRIHPLCDHMTDVAACMDAVARCAAVRQALDTAAGRPLTEVDLARLAVLAFLHDIGKANAGFQGRCWLASDPRSRHWPHACGHSTEGWLLFADGGCAIPNGADILRDLPIDALASWGEAAVTALLRASISHHGRPVDEGRQALHVWRPVLDPMSGRYDPASAVSEMARRVVSSYPLAFTDGHPELPDRPALAHLFGGLVQLADWLGSDTRPGFFSYTEPGEDRTTTAATRARHAVTMLGLDAGAWRASVAQGPPSFSKAFQVEQPRPMQTAAAAHDLGPVVILEAETGSGKTEAALWRFLHLFRLGQVDSLYFALPTRVAASQLYERVRDFVVRVWPEDAPVVVRALPGYEAADGEQKISLPDYQVLWPDQPDDNRAAQRWAAESPKRFLAATIAVGTVDQALLGALRVRHAHLRQALLTRSLLVVDEVHASDAYMTVLLERLLQAHVACGGQALLLSATLGAAARTRYLNVGHTSRQLPVVPLQDAMAQPYPALGTRTSPHAIRLDAVAGNPRHKHLCWQTLDAIEDAERIARLAVDAAQRGARVLVVRNTVPSAVATLRAVEVLCAAQGGDWLFKVNGTSTLHHSRFSRQDRPQLDQAVQAQLGKHRADHRGRIVIGTQTLEQSLDIDADLLITDLCPMDVLLQRIGRLHRHERPSTQHPDDRRPAGFESPTAWVLTPARHDLAPLLKRARHGLGPMRTGAGLEGVYVDLRILEATRRLIDAQPTRLIPQDNRALVELATHQEALTAIERELGADWQRFGQELDGSLSAKSSLARLHALPYDQPYDERLTFPDSEQKIATRLGAADRLVVIDPPLTGPFGQPVRQLTLRHHQVPVGLSPDALPTAVTPLPDHAGVEFTLGDRRYRYDRFGLDRLKASTA